MIPMEIAIWILAVLLGALILLVRNDDMPEKPERKEPGVGKKRGQ